MSAAALRFMATAPRGLSDLAAAELRALGIGQLSERAAGVRFSGELAAYGLGMPLVAVASRVLLRSAIFPHPTRMPSTLARERSIGVSTLLLAARWPANSPGNT